MFCRGMWGLGSTDRKRLVRDLVSQAKPDIVILQEMKLKRMEGNVVRSLCHFSSVGWIELPSMGATGGILIYWDKEKVEYEESWAEVFSISIVATVKGDNQKWVLSWVYEPPSSERLELFLVELQTIRDRRQLPWCVGGTSMKF